MVNRRHFLAMPSRCARREAHPRMSRFAIACAVVAAFASATDMFAQQVPGNFPGRCAEPPKRPSEVGCYLSAIQPIDKLPEGPLFWHLYSYGTRAAAEAAKAESLSTVAESLDKVWLFTIATAQWRPAAGE